MPRMIKFWSILCTVLLSVSIVAAPTAPAWAFSDISMGTTAEMLAMTDTATADEALTDTEIDGLVGDIAPEKPGVDNSTVIPRAASGSIRVNTACRGIAASGTYFGVWKKLGANKAKCKEGAGGPAGQWLSPTNGCRIVTLNDGVIDGGTIIPATKCVTL